MVKYTYLDGACHIMMGTIFPTAGYLIIQTSNMITAVHRSSLHFVIRTWGWTATNWATHVFSSSPCLPCGGPCNSPYICILCRKRLFFICGTTEHNTALAQQMCSLNRHTCCQCSKVFTNEFWQLGVLDDPFFCWLDKEGSSNCMFDQCSDTFECAYPYPPTFLTRKNFMVEW